jgi:hypothetical protein
MFGRRRKRLADAHELYIGPETKRFRDIRKHLREASTALDKGRCPDAALHLHEARDLMKQGRHDVGADTRNWLADENQRLVKSCRTTFGTRARQPPQPPPVYHPRMGPPPGVQLPPFHPRMGPPPVYHPRMGPPPGVQLPPLRGRRKRQKKWIETWPAKR